MQRTYGMSWRENEERSSMFSLSQMGRVEAGVTRLRYVMAKKRRTKFNVFVLPWREDEGRTPTIKVCDEHLWNPPETTSLTVNADGYHPIYFTE